MQEFVRNYDRDDGIARGSIKIDLMKDHDSVDWDFLFETMVVMNFPRQFVQQEEQCVNITKFSIEDNGELEGYFAYGSYIVCSADDDSFLNVNDTLKEF